MMPAPQMTTLQTAELCDMVWYGNMGRGCSGDGLVQGEQERGKAGRSRCRSACCRCAGYGCCAEGKALKLVPYTRNGVPMQGLGTGKEAALCIRVS